MKRNKNQKSVYFEELVSIELKKARVKHGPMVSFHEAYAIILEELEEFKNEVFKKEKNRDLKNCLAELVQVAASAQKAAEDLKLIIKKINDE